MGVTDAQLIAEFANDPAGLGYAGKNAEQKHALINQVRESILISIIVPKATVALVLDGSHALVASLSDAIKKEVWRRRFDVLLSLAEGVRPADIADMLAAGIADGVMVQQQVGTLNALGTRTGSRAEQLWGEGVVIDLNSVARVS